MNEIFVVRSNIYIYVCMYILRTRFNALMYSGGNNNMHVYKSVVPLVSGVYN